MGGVGSIAQGEEVGLSGGSGEGEAGGIGGRWVSWGKWGGSGDGGCGEELGGVGRVGGVGGKWGMGGVGWFCVLDKAWGVETNATQSHSHAVGVYGQGEIVVRGRTPQ